MIANVSRSYLVSEEVFTHCPNAMPISVYVKSRKIICVRPLVVEERDFKIWCIGNEAG